MRLAGVDVPVSGTGCDCSVPSCLRLITSDAIALLESTPPKGVFQQRFTCWVNMAIHVPELLAARPVAVPAAAVGLTAAPVFSARVGSRLSINAAFIRSSNERSCFGFG